MPAATNWARNLRFSAARTVSPRSVAELQELVAGTRRIHPRGSGHSFSPVADTTGDLVWLGRMPRMIRVDAGAATVTVNAALTYAELGPELHARGLALPNLASLPHLTVAGACATATHGSGVGNGNLATAVRRVVLVAATGELAELTPASDPDRFDATVAGLGTLGIVTELTLGVEPAYEVRQRVFEGLGFPDFTRDAEAVLAAAFSVSLFTDFRGPVFTQVWLKERTGCDDLPAGGFMGAVEADGPRHPVSGRDPAACTEQGGVPGPWHQRLPHFRADAVPSSGEELQSEYLLPRESAADALVALAGIAGEISPVLQICELRTVAADRQWLSPASARDSLGVHFTWIPDTAAVMPVVRSVEARLAAFGARPHWAKLFAMTPDLLAGVYPRIPDFRAMRTRHDPLGKFGNAFLDARLAGDG